MAQLQFRSDDNPKKWPLRYGNGGDGDKVVSSNETYNGARAGLVGQYTADPNTQNPVITIDDAYRDWETDRKSTRLNSSHITRSRMPSSA